MNHRSVVVTGTVVRLATGQMADQVRVLWRLPAPRRPEPPGSGSAVLEAPVTLVPFPCAVASVPVCKEGSTP